MVLDRERGVVDFIVKSVGEFTRFFVVHNNDLFHH